jgi:hypothetical protein
MKHSRLRPLLTGLLAVTAFFVFSAPAHAVEFRATTTVGGKPGLFGLNYDMTPRAKVTETQTGNPVVGVTVQFQAEAPSGYLLPVCSAVTNADGVAKCGGAKAVKAVLAIMQSPNKEYIAYFSGQQVGEVIWQDSYDRVRYLHK